MKVLEIMLFAFEALYSSHIITLRSSVLKPEHDHASAFTALSFICFPNVIQCGLKAWEH